MNIILDSPVLLQEQLCMTGNGTALPCAWKHGEFEHMLWKSADCICAVKLKHLIFPSAQLLLGLTWPCLQLKACLSANALLPLMSKVHRK